MSDGGLPLKKKKKKGKTEKGQKGTDWDFVRGSEFLFAYCLSMAEKKLKKHDPICKLHEKTRRREGETGGGKV